MAKLIYTNSRGDSIELGQTAPFFVTKIEGFSDVENNISTYQSYNQDGESIVNENLGSRYMVIEGEFLLDRQEGRNRLIKVFNPKLQGILKYINGNFIKEIECKPERSPIISSTNRATIPYLINLIAPKPFWKDVKVSKEEIAIWRGSSEFPSELVEEGIELGFREPSLIVNILNKGDVPCGMRIQFKALATVVNPSLFNINTREYFKIKRTMEAGEIITVTTHFQNKRVMLYKNGVTSNAFNWIDLDSTFLQLDVGDNLMRYDADEGLDNLEVSIYYTSQYLGV
ncbi:MAG: phage tail family protein [Tissierellaceae bacterium]|nr:phage tail family protein [Tissierellaceae bacterium]